MSNFTDFFAAAAGGGSMPKYQDFTSSGNFTPSQALIDAGGRVGYFSVGGGERGWQDNVTAGGAGGRVVWGYDTLTSTSACDVTIGAGGSGSANANGGNTTIAFNSAGGTAITAQGGSGLTTPSHPGFGAASRDTYYASAASSGFFGGYGAGGAPSSGTYDNSGGVLSPYANTGNGSYKNNNAASGFVRVIWFE